MWFLALLVIVIFAVGEEIYLSYDAKKYQQSAEHRRLMEQINNLLKDLE